MFVIINTEVIKLNSTAACSSFVQLELTMRKAGIPTRNVNALCYLVSRTQADCGGEFFTEGGRPVMICLNHVNSNCIANFIIICIIIMC